MQPWLRMLFFLLVIKPLLAVIMGVNVFGRHHLRGLDQFILVANHNSHLDAAALLNLFPLQRLHRIHPVAASDYFMANRLLAWFSTTFLNVIPISRSGFTRSDNPITRMGEALEQGKSLILFPEGTRGQPEEMAPFKSGVAHLIRKYPQVPVVPVFLRGMGRSLPKGEYVLVPFFCDVVIGPPLYPMGSRDEIVAQLEQAVIRLENQIP